MVSRANSIARAVISQYNKLPTKRKPLIRDNGHHEWVPLSGIVAECEGELICLALATGMKCLPASRLSESKGVGLHDWHAEILAIRTFNRHLLDECGQSDNGPRSILLRNHHTRNESKTCSTKPFKINPEFKLHMYCSEAPCGDASMELTMADQEDAAPWDVPAGNTTAGTSSELPGRAYFSKLGVVRRKPARGDAPPTLSKSCSDKIALKQCTSLLASLTSLFVDVENAYIDTLVLPQLRYSETACRRAFSAQGRMSPLLGRKWSDGYSFRPFRIETTNVEFQYSKRSIEAISSKISTSNMATAWCLSGVEESIIGGVTQGRKPFDARGASRMSRREMWKSARDLAIKLDNVPEILQHVCAESYQAVKDGPLLSARKAVKADARSEALANWVTNQGDSSFSIDPEHNTSK